MQLPRKERSTLRTSPSQSPRSNPPSSGRRCSTASTRKRCLRRTRNNRREKRKPTSSPTWPIRWSWPVGHSPTPAAKSPCAVSIAGNTKTRSNISSASGSMPRPCLLMEGGNTFDTEGASQFISSDQIEQYLKLGAQRDRRVVRTSGCRRPGIQGLSRRTGEHRQRREPRGHGRAERDLRNATSNGKPKSTGLPFFRRTRKPSRRSARNTASTT